MRPAVLFFFLFALSTCAGRAWAGGGFDLLVCYPGGGTIKARQAKPAMVKMLGVLQSLGNWPEDTFRHEFTSNVDECRKLLADKKPAFMITSLGIFLEHRLAHHLTPLARPRTTNGSSEIYRVLVKKGGYKTLKDLKGKTLGGSLLTEPAFLRRVVFKGGIDPAAHFQLKPTKRALRALRKLAKGQLDAVLVNDLQFRALASLPFSGDIQPVFTSDPLPLLGLAADESKTTPAERERLTGALSKMCGHKKGKEICEMFGLEAFVPADPHAYEAVILRWDSK